MPPAVTPLPPILLIDDSHEDLFLTKRLLVRAGVKHPIVTVDDAEEAIVFLRAATLHGASGLLPRLVFCDLRMPKIDGFELLKWVRSEPRLARLPVIILTGGDVPEDRARAKRLRADAFLVKFPSADVLKQHIDQFGS